MLNFCEPVIDYLIQLVSSLQSQSDSRTLPFVKAQWEESKLSLLEAKAFYESDEVLKEAEYNGWFAILTYSATAVLGAGLISFGICAIPIGLGVGISSIGVGAFVGIASGAVTGYVTKKVCLEPYLANLPATIEECNAERTDYLEALRNVPVQGIERFYSDD